ncbi:hypothetical protein MRX96_025625 [Rhipicephalus microplus]
MKGLALLNMLVILLVIANVNAYRDAVEKIMEGMGKVAATAGYKGSPLLNAVVEGVKNGLATSLGGTSTGLPGS